MVGGEELKLGGTTKDEWNLHGKRGEGKLSERGTVRPKQEMRRHQMCSEDLAEPVRLQ